MFACMMRRAFAAALLSLLSYAAASAQATQYQSDRMNQGTVGIVSGGVAGTYVRVAADLAAVLDDGDNLRVLAMIGKGSVQNIADVLYLKGVDIGIVQSDVLAYIKRENLFAGVERRINFITKLYNEEFHLLVRSDITQLSDLAGKKVNFDNRGSGTFITSTVVFDTLGISRRADLFRPGPGAGAAQGRRHLRDGLCRGQAGDLVPRSRRRPTICACCRCRRRTS